MNQPVVIAGGGPVGLLLAFELGRYGVPSVVLEARSDHYDDDRVGTFHSRLVDLFTERGLMADLGEPPQWPGVHFGMVWLDLNRLDGEYNLLVAQTAVERVLETRAAALGADVRRGHTVTGFTQDDAGVSVSVRGADGAEYELRGDYLVGADGVDSTVRHLAGIGVRRTGKSWYGVIGDFTSYDGEFDAGVRDGGVFGALPEGTERGYWRLQTLEFDQDGPPDSVPVTTEELTHSIKRITGESKQVGDPIWMRRHGGVTQLAERYREGRVFLAGEAAHNYVPTASHGLNTGLNDAANLGWKLAAATQGWAPEGLLDTYHDERHLAGARACQGAEAQMALIHPLEKVRALREVFTELVSIDEVNRRLVTWATDVRYPYAAADDESLVGHRISHVTLLDASGDEVSVADVLGGGRGVLLDLSGKDFGDVTGWQSRVDVVRVQPSQELDTTALVVRPDGYVVWAGADQEGLADALTAWFGAPDSA